MQGDYFAAMAISCRLARPDEAALVYTLIQEAFEEYRGRLEPPSSAHEETVESVRAAMTSGGAALAHDGAEAVGAALFKPQRDHLYVRRVSVAPQYRGQGIARGLMLFLENVARRGSRSAIEIEVRQNLVSNVTLYQSLGYRITRSEAHPRNPAFNSLTMRKDV